LQLEVTQDLVNTGTVVAVAQETGRASKCITEVVPKDNVQKFLNDTQVLVDFVENNQLNTEDRKQAQKEFYRGNLDSYSSLTETCDIELATLPN
jgi:hypothetical protein